MDIQEDINIKNDIGKCINNILKNRHSILTLKFPKSLCLNEQSVVKGLKKFKIEKEFNINVQNPDNGTITMHIGPFSSTLEIADIDYIFKIIHKCTQDHISTTNLANAIKGLSTQRNRHKYFQILFKGKCTCTKNKKKDIDRNEKADILAEARKEYKAKAQIMVEKREAAKMKKKETKYEDDSDDNNEEQQQKSEDEPEDQQPQQRDTWSKQELQSKELNHTFIDWVKSTDIFAEGIKYILECLELEGVFDFQTAFALDDDDWKGIIKKIGFRKIFLVKLSALSQE